MAYFRPSIDADGIHIPTYDDILSYLIEQYKSVFGNDVYLGIDSKDYQMLSVFAKAMDDFAALAVDAYNARSPLYATGDSLDVLCTLVGITRYPAEKAVASIHVVGVADTVIPSGSKVVDVDGGLWSTSEDVTIGDGGASVGIVKDEAGEYKLVEGSISTIYTPVIGWFGVSNETIGTVGKDVENDEELRARMRRTLVTKAYTNEISIGNAVMNVDGVDKVQVCVNNSDDTDDRGIPAHSICVLVNGGDSHEIAEEIFANKAPGIGTYGSVSESVTDAYGNAVTVNFSRVTMDDIMIYVVGTVYDSRVDVDSLRERIKSAIFDYVGGLDVGESLVVNRLYPVIYSAAGISSLDITDLYLLVSGEEIRTRYDIDWDEKISLENEDSVDADGIELGS